jgi:RimJ/RimL family protein N-acetyltransferase
MQFERTFDMNLVRWILTHPSVWSHLVDDFHPSKERYQPCDHPEIWYVLARDGEELLGLLMFVPRSGICSEVHIALLPGHGYRRAREAARGAIRYYFAGTISKRLVAIIPSYNWWSQRAARDVGFVEFGRNAKAYQKNGVLYDEVYLGVSRA